MDDHKIAMASAASVLVLGAVLLAPGPWGDVINAPTWFIVPWLLLVVPVMAYVSVRLNRAWNRKRQQQWNAMDPTKRTFILVGVTILFLGAAAFNIVNIQASNDRMAALDTTCTFQPGEDGTSHLAFQGPRPGPDPTGTLLAEPGDRVVEGPLIEGYQPWLNATLASDVSVHRLSLALRQDGSWVHGGTIDAPVVGRTYDFDNRGLAPFEAFRWEVELAEASDADRTIAVAWAGQVCQTE